MKNYFMHLMILFGFILLAGSCQYKFIVEPVAPPPNPEDTVSFSLQVIPIWNDGNNCVSCHNGQPQRPDLRPESAYNEIMSMGLVDNTTAEESLIYKHPNPDETGSHTWKKYTNSQAATVLQWIKQGAKNN